MKTILTFSGALLITMFANAQSGTVVYNETMKLEIHLEGAGAGMEDMFPRERTSARLLHFSEDASLYLNGPGQEEQEVNEEMAGGGRMVIKIDEPDEQLFFDIKNQEITEQRDFMSRMFLIVDKADTNSWKLTGNRREILGYPCMEAYYLKDSVKTVAWFAPSIPVSTGPAGYNGLPGLILGINVNDGKRVITATSVTMSDVSALLMKPKKGKKVNREEFNKMVEEKTGENQGEGGDVIMIKIRN